MTERLFAPCPVPSSILTEDSRAGKRRSCATPIFPIFLRFNGGLFFFASCAGGCTTCAGIRVMERSWWRYRFLLPSYHAGWTSYVAGTLSIVYSTFLQHNAPFPTRDMRNGKLPISNLWQIALSLSLSKIQLILKRKP